MTRRQRGGLESHEERDLLWKCAFEHCASPFKGRIYRVGNHFKMCIRRWNDVWKIVKFVDQSWRRDEQSQKNTAKSMVDFPSLPKKKFFHRQNSSQKIPKAYTKYLALVKCTFPVCPLVLEGCHKLQSRGLLDR